MIKKHVIYSLGFIVIMLVLVSCGGSDDPTPPPSVNPPTAATLQAPANDEVCLTGVSINSTQSEVAFSWNISQHTDSYNLAVKNLNSGQSSSYSTNTNDTSITLNKGEPYSWYVVSKSNSVSQTVQSDTWKFYLAGDGTVNYAPFPANIIHPTPGSTISGDTTYLKWEGNDVDNDIASYDVYLDQTDGSTLVGNIAIQQMENVAIISGKTYYWKVITKDVLGNSSDSGVFSFKVN